MDKWSRLLVTLVITRKTTICDFSMALNNAAIDAHCSTKKTQFINFRGITFFLFFSRHLTCLGCCRVITVKRQLPQDSQQKNNSANYARDM